MLSQREVKSERAEKVFAYVNIPLGVCESIIAT
jgi:hypothetical protein